MKAKIDEITKENVAYVKQIAECKSKYEEKVIEYEYLQEDYDELQNNKCELEKSYEINFRVRFAIFFTTIFNRELA